MPVRRPQSVFCPGESATPFRPVTE
jgi:hypothetical protein